MQINSSNSPPDSRNVATAQDSLSLSSAPGISSTDPLNVWSRSPEAIGRALSNWAHLPFIFDGVQYESVEGMYASLLQLDPEKRAVVRTYWGYQAKRAIPKRRPEAVHYGGHLIAYPSDAFFAILTRGIYAKCTQHPDIARAFVATRPRPIIHDTGYPAKRGTASPSAGWFCAALSEIREALFLATDPKNRSIEPVHFSVELHLQGTRP